MPDHAQPGGPLVSCEECGTTGIPITKTRRIAGTILAFICKPCDNRGY